jgi:FlaA1/EpsC-like NDP-sugar epimerase
MTRYFMTIPEAGWLILDAAAIGRSGDLFVLDMGEPVRILDLANDLVRLLGRSADSVSIEFTGLRPGEKLHEVLFYENEVIEATDVPKVLRTVAPGPPPDVRERIDALMMWATSRSEGILRDAAFQLVTDLAGTSPQGGLAKLDIPAPEEVPLIRSLLAEPSLPPSVPG